MLSSCDLLNDDLQFLYAYHEDPAQLVGQEVSDQDHVCSNIFFGLNLIFECLFFFLTKKQLRPV
jgi:hypothetical protein